MARSQRRARCALLGDLARRSDAGAYAARTPLQREAGESVVLATPARASQHLEGLIRDERGVRIAPETED